MTIKKRLEAVEEKLDAWTQKQAVLMAKIKSMLNFQREVWVHMARNQVDLHDRLNYIKTYMGMDEFIATLDGKKRA